MKQLLFLLGFFIALNSYTQNQISGKITDKNSGEILEGVNIYLPDQYIGTVSDKDGNYIIDNIKTTKILVRYSYIGYQTVVKEVKLKPNENTINIEMEGLVIEGQEIVISGNFESSQHDNALKINSINSKQLNNNLSPGLIENISSTPGVSLISKGPGLASPVIRGLSLSNILFLYESVPLHNYQFSENHPYLVDKNGLQRVEIIKGPASLIYGSGAVGGVINLIEKDVPIKNTIKGNAGVDYFGNTKGINTYANIGLNKNGWFARVKAGIISHQDYTHGNGELATNTRFNRNSIGINVGHIGNKSIHRLIYNYGHNKIGMALEPALVYVTDNNRKNQAWYQDLTDHLFILKNKFFFNASNLEANFAYQQNNRRLYGEPTNDVFQLVHMQLNTISYNLKSKLKAGENTNFVIGSQGYMQTNRNFDAPNHILPDADLYETSLNIMVQHKLKGNLKLEGGLRYGYNHINVPEQKAAGHSHGDEEEHEEVLISYNNGFSNISASLGSSWNISEIMLARINVSSAFRSPNLAELTSYGLHGTRFEMGNPDLKNQRNTEIDLGYHIHTKHLSFDAAIFYNNIANYIYLSPTNDTMDDGDKIYRYLQKEATLYGGELNLHFHPHPYDWFHFDASYSYTLGQLNEGGYLPFIPANQIYGEISLIDHKYKSFNESYFKIGLKYAFEQNHPSEYENSSPDYILFNLSLGSTIKVVKQDVIFNLSVKNLFNTAYTDHLSTLRDVGIENMGRSINLSIKIPFGGRI